MLSRKPERGADGPAVSLVFPAYNPGPALEYTWPEVERFLRQTAPDWEVLFVCDGCTDGTPDRLTRWSASLRERVRVLSYAPNRGKGHAVRHGLRAARGRYRLFTDVDLAYGFDDVRRVAATLERGADVAIASRLHPDSALLLPPRLQGYAYRRYLQSLVFSALVRRMLPVTQRDTQAGLNGLTARAAELLLPRLRCDGFEFDCELLTACARHALAVVEVPVCVRYRDAASTTSAGNVLRMVRALWAIRRAWPAGSGVGAGDQPGDAGRADRKAA